MARGKTGKWPGISQKEEKSGNIFNDIIFKKEKLRRPFLFVFFEESP